MPTRNRREFIGQAVWYFLRQDYEARELIIVDDGTDGVGDLVPDDPRVRYVRADRPLSLAAKRNLACQAGCGDLIAHWDDDDWQAPNRLSRQVQALAETQAQLCALADVPHYQLQQGRAWTDRRVHPGTLMYSRSLWQVHPFEDSRNGDEALFEQIPAGKKRHLVDPSLYVAVLHGDNWRSLIPKAPHWQRLALSMVLDEIGYDTDFYIHLRDRHLPERDRPVGPIDAPTVTLVSSFLVYDGYGSMAEYLALGLQRAGARVQIQPLMIDWQGLSTEFRDAFHGQKANRQAPVLFFSWPDATVNRFDDAEGLFINTMWESSRLPADWVRRINRARAVIVPTRFVAKTLQASGVSVPVAIIPEGIDPEVYDYYERPARSTFTTLIVGPVADRKHTREAITAWKLAFAGDVDAQLVIKARFGYSAVDEEDARIQLVDENEKTRGIAHWYRRADALLALGSEGFGLPLVEGMATGLPVVALNAEGQADVCRQAPDCVLPVEPARYRPYIDQRYGPCGHYAIPDVEQAAEHLRWIRDHRQEALTLGRRASAWARAERNVWQKGPAVLEVMERHVQPPRPLRQNHLIWTPSWEETCGVAEYTRHLTGGLPGVRIARELGDWKYIRLLHVQHEPSLFSGQALLSAVRQGRRANRPVVITEHAVQPFLHPWERDASALVALTSAGADQLRHQWPDQHIAHIPVGCHEWFPRRKRRRGRVIGAFGFLAHHKGFWQLLEVLRQLPGTSLRLFSHARSAEVLAAWQGDTADLPVTHVQDYLTEKQVAERLAAETDLVVFWYPDMPWLSASAAVCVALASGVPVLTSPTAWFRDLQEVTYQPDNLTEGVHRLLEDTALRHKLTAAAREYGHENSWERIAQRHQELWQSLLDK